MSLCMHVKACICHQGRLFFLVLMSMCVVVDMKRCVGLYRVTVRGGRCILDMLGFLCLNFQCNTSFSTKDFFFFFVAALWDCSVGEGLKTVFPSCLCCSRWYLTDSGRRDNDFQHAVALHVCYIVNNYAEVGLSGWPPALTLILTLSYVYSELNNSLPFLNCSSCRAFGLRIICNRKFNTPNRG